MMAKVLHPDKTYYMPGRLMSHGTLIQHALEVFSFFVPTGFISINQHVSILN